MKNVFKLIDVTNIDKNDSYILSYPHLLSFAEKKTEFNPSDFIVLSHMVYGWMPTIITIGDYENLERGAKLLNKAKSGEELNLSDYELLKSLVNNSIVGVSKLLHFVAPEYYPIWDSRIYQFCHQKKAYNNANNIKHYLSYLKEIKSLASLEGSDVFYQTVDNQLGYKVTKMRALELIMFLNSPQFNKKA